MATKQRAAETVSLEELEGGLPIDQHRLEEACVAHSELFYRVAKQLELAMSRRDAAYQAAKEAEAEADARIRFEAADNEERATDKTVEARRALDPKVVEAKERHNRLKLQAGLLSALKESFEQRGYALRDLVQLHIRSYYGSDIERSAANVRSNRAEFAKRDMQRQRVQQRG